jgi:hypothetical protein
MEFAEAVSRAAGANRKVDMGTEPSWAHLTGSRWAAQSALMPHHLAKDGEVSHFMPALFHSRSAHASFC